MGLDSLSKPRRRSYVLTGKQERLMRRMTKRQRHEYVLPRARELARSGRFMDRLAIEHELHYEERITEARFCLDDERVRQELDRLIAEAQKGQADA